MKSIFLDNSGYPSVLCSCWVLHWSKKKWFFWKDTNRKKVIWEQCMLINKEPVRFRASSEESKTKKNYDWIFNHKNVIQLYCCEDLNEFPYYTSNKEKKWYNVRRYHQFNTNPLLVFNQFLNHSFSIQFFML